MVGPLTSVYLGTRSGRDQVLARSQTCAWQPWPVRLRWRLISTDRHTVEPWFQGKIPFAFNLPELQNTEFSLLGGRMT